jgi:hypothetical protein
VTAVSATERLSYERRVRPRQALVAGAAGVLLVVSAVLQLAGPHTNVSEITLGLITEKKRFGLDLTGAVIQGAAWLAVAWTLIFLLGATRARDQQVPPYIRYVVLIGAPITAIGIVGYITSYGVQANHFTGAQTYPQANHLLSAPLLAVFQVMDYAGELAVAVAIVLVSLQAMRAGLLTRFMGYLGIIAGILVLFVITPVPIVQAYWLIGLAVLFAGRWPSGMPPSWQTGRVERWPSSQELREQRMRERGGGAREKPSREKPAREPVAAAAAPKQQSRSTTPKRKRKRRR